jgi:polyhydroxyalkanoate synthesis repressor PhaR
MAKPGQPIIIKKYANRRLYNTRSRIYVTLEDLAAMRRGGEDFLVYDAKTGDDITRSVTAQLTFNFGADDEPDLPPIPVHLLYLFKKTRRG